MSEAIHPKRRMNKIIFNCIVLENKKNKALIMDTNIINKILNDN
jgi:hypothetical protein